MRRGRVRRVRTPAAVVTCLLVLALGGCQGAGADEDPGRQYTVAEAGRILRHDAKKLLSQRYSTLPIGKPTITAAAKHNIACADGGVRRVFQATAKITDPSYLDRTSMLNVTVGALSKLGYKLTGPPDPSETNLILEVKDSPSIRLLVQLLPNESVAIHGRTSCFASQSSED